MSSDQDAKAGGRRQFLKLASLGAVAGTVAAVTGQGERAAEAAAPEPEPEGKGYRETAHVKKVYELARF
jgi:nitrous oxide reductase